MLPAMVMLPPPAKSQGRPPIVPSETFGPVWKFIRQPTQYSVTLGLAGVSRPWMLWNRIFVPMAGPPAPA